MGKVKELMLDLEESQHLPAMVGYQGYWLETADGCPIMYSKKWGAIAAVQEFHQNEGRKVKLFFSGIEIVEEDKREKFFTTEGVDYWAVVPQLEEAI